MTLSRDERAAKSQQTKEERRNRRRATDEKRPWLFPLIVGVAVVILIGAIVVSIAMGFAF
jgi:hypothetical protein